MGRSDFALRHSPYGAVLFAAAWRSIPYPLDDRIDHDLGDEASQGMEQAGYIS